MLSDISIDGILSIIALLLIFIGTTVAILRKDNTAELSRNQKRSYRVKVNGKEVNVLKYLRNISSRMPALYHKRTGIPIDHYKNLKKAYMIQGSMKDVHAYVDKVRRDTIKLAKRQGVKVIKRELYG